MELRTYGKILWRRIWIIALVVGVVVIYVSYQYYTSHKSSGSSKTYHADVDIRIGLQAPAHSSNQTFTDYVATSEVLADEFATSPIFTSPAFANQVIEQIRTDMPIITTHYPQGDLGDWTNGSAITSAFTAARTHSIVDIGVNWPTEAGTWAIARAVGEVSTAHITDYLNYQVTSDSTNNAYYPIAAARVINDTGKITTITSASTTKTSLLLALLIVGLILGIALAFLVEYLDDRIYDTSQVVQMLQLPIYGEIPSAPKPDHSQAHSSSAL